MSIQENGQDEALFEGFNNQARDTSDDLSLDLGLSDSLGKLANRSNAFKQRLEDFDAIILKTLMRLKSVWLLPR